MFAAWSLTSKWLGGEVYESPQHRLGLPDLEGIVDPPEHLAALLHLCAGRFPTTESISGQRSSSSSVMPPRFSLHGLSEEDVAPTSCWKLVKLLPTSLSVLQELADPAAVDWRLHLSQPALPHTAYLLQAAISYLKPPLDPTRWPSALPPSHWFHKFLRFASHVFSITFSLPLSLSLCLCLCLSVSLSVSLSLSLCLSVSYPTVTRAHVPQVG